LVEASPVPRASAAPLLISGERAVERDNPDGGPSALHDVALAQLVASAFFNPPVHEHEARSDKLFGLTSRGGQRGQFDELA
jgi:hypothetical protein